MVTTWRLGLGLTAALALASCHQGDAPTAAAPTGNDVKMGTYRVVLQTPGGELPFGLELKQQDSHPVGYLINGEERLLLSEVKIAGSHLEIPMPGYENVLKADAVGNELHGEIFLVKLNDKNQHVPLHATLGDTYRFFGQPASDNADVSGRWAMKLIDDSGAPEAVVGQFSQAHDVVSGTILTATGDHRYLAGQVKGDELYLSTFDGAHVFLYKAKVAADGALAGDFWSGLAYHAKWSGNRDEHAALPDAYALTALRGSGKQFEFSFPDLAGNTVTS